MLREIRPWSVDSLDGGATDVPILGPMEFENRWNEMRMHYMSCLSLHSLHEGLTA